MHKFDHKKPNEIGETSLVANEDMDKYPSKLDEKELDFQSYVINNCLNSPEEFNDIKENGLG